MKLSFETLQYLKSAKLKKIYHCVIDVGLVLDQGDKEFNSIKIEREFVPWIQLFGSSNPIQLLPVL